MSAPNHNYRNNIAFLNGTLYILTYDNFWYAVNGQVITLICRYDNDMDNAASIIDVYNGEIYYSVAITQLSYGYNTYEYKAFNGTGTRNVKSFSFILNSQMFSAKREGIYKLNGSTETMIVSCANSSYTITKYGSVVLIENKDSSRDNTYHIFDGNSAYQTNMFDGKNNVIFSKYMINGKTINKYDGGRVLGYMAMYDYNTDTRTEILSLKSIYHVIDSSHGSYTGEIDAFTVYNNDIYILDTTHISSSSGIVKEVRISKFTAPENVYNPNTLIIDKSNLFSGGKYSTEIAAPKIENNQRFLTGFDDVFYFADSSFDWNAPMYYGDGSRWIKFKN